MLAKHNVAGSSPAVRSRMKNTYALEKEAQVIDKLIAEGKLKEEELPLLVQQGLDQETVDYWNKRKAKPLFQKLLDAIK